MRNFIAEVMVRRVHSLTNELQSWGWFNVFVASWTFFCIILHQGCFDPTSPSALSCSAGCFAQKIQKCLSSTIEDSFNTEIDAARCSCQLDVKICHVQLTKHGGLFCMWKSIEVLEVALNLDALHILAYPLSFLHAKIRSDKMELRGRDSSEKNTSEINILFQILNQDDAHTMVSLQELVRDQAPHCCKPCLAAIQR